MSSKAHRLREEERQIRFFALPPTSVVRRHQHVLPTGTNWDNLFAGISSETGPASSFFRERQIKWWQSPATGDPRGLRGPTHNTLSSQVACVNALLPLASDPLALTAILRRLDPEVESVVAVEDGHFATAALVEFEWVGARGRRSLEGTAATRGQRVTSSDALLVGQLHDGTRRAFFMEWKYVETGAEADKASGSQGITRRDRYDVMFEALFRNGAALDDFLVEPLYQLTRLALLAQSVVEGGQLPGVTSARTVLVCPRANDVYRVTRAGGRIRARHGAATVVDALRAGLRAPETIIDACSADVVAAARSAGDHSSLRMHWSEYMRSRYGW